MDLLEGAGGRLSNKAPRGMTRIFTCVCTLKKMSRMAILFRRSVGQFPVRRSFSIRNEGQPYVPNYTLKPFFRRHPDANQEALQNEQLIDPSHISRLYCSTLGISFIDLSPPLMERVTNKARTLFSLGTLWSEEGISPLKLKSAFSDIYKQSVTFCAKQEWHSLRRARLITPKYFDEITSQAAATGPLTDLTRKGPQSSRMNFFEMDEKLKVKIWHAIKMDDFHLGSGEIERFCQIVCRMESQQVSITTLFLTNPQLPPFRN